MNELTNPALGVAIGGIGVSTLVFVAKWLLKVQADVSRRYDTQVGRFRAEVEQMRLELDQLRVEKRSDSRRIAALEAEVVRLGGNPDQLTVKA
jgi:hypothetical protein